MSVDNIDQLKQSSRKALSWESLKWLVLGGIAAMTVVPILYALLMSVTPIGEVESLSGVQLIPSEITLEYWRVALFQDIRASIINSVIISLGTPVISLLVVIPTSYAFGRHRFPGRKFLFYLIILSLLIPKIILTIPIAETWISLGIFNTYLGVMLSYQTFVVPFGIWVLRDYFEGLPVNLEEAAQVYGCTQFGAFRRVILPIAIPAVIAVGFISFTIAWNDFLFNTALTTGTGPRTAPVYLYNRVTGAERPFWSTIMAQVIIIGTPPTILYLSARTYVSEAFALS